MQKYLHFFPQSGEAFRAYRDVSGCYGWAGLEMTSVSSSSPRYRRNIFFSAWGTVCTGGLFTLSGCLECGCHLETEREWRKWRGSMWGLPVSGVQGHYRRASQGPDSPWLSTFWTEATFKHDHYAESADIVTACYQSLASWSFDPGVGGNCTPDWVTWLTEGAM